MCKKSRKASRFWVGFLILTFGLSMEASANLIIDIKDCQFAIPEGYALRLGEDPRVTHFYFHQYPEKGAITISKGESDMVSLKAELVRRLNYTVEEGETVFGNYMIFRSSQGVVELDAGVAQILGWTVRFKGQAVGLIERFYSDCEGTRSPGSGLAK